MAEDHAKAAREALAAWEAGQLEVAAQQYAAALSGADRTHYATPMWAGAYARVLAALGRDEDARAQFQEALDLELEQGEGAESAATAFARYSLAEHLVSVGEAEEALTVARAGLGAANALEAVLRCVEAEALASAGNLEGARDAAVNALAAARSQEQRARLLERIGHLVSH
jgi:hypothetical protein